MRARTRPLQVSRSSAPAQTGPAQAVPAAQSQAVPAQRQPVPAAQSQAVPAQRQPVPAERLSDATDSLRAYLRQIGRIPLLTAYEEVRLAYAIEAGVLAEDRLSAQPGLGESDREELLELVEAGAAAKVTLVQSNLRLVVAVAKRYGGSSLGLLDLVQEGNIGLIRAVEKFDYQLGFKFSTYATWWIKQAIARSCADQSRTIRVPVHVVEASQRALRVQRAMFQALGRQPSLAELAARLELTPGKTQDLLNLTDEPMSLDRPIGTDDAARLCDLVSDDSSELALERVGLLMLHSDVEQLLTSVTAREQQVLRLRFGVGGGRTHTLEEIGSALGVTRERARQIEARALARIRMTHSLEGYREYLR